MKNQASALAPAPLRIGVVMPASGGAGHADFTGHLRASGHAWQVRELRVAMEGPGAPEGIARAILRLGAEDSEVVVVVRGGGAASTLAAFDAESVARAIAGCAAPVLVAVGHVSDRTVADVVAHTSVPTPTAAAVWLVDRHRVQEDTAAAAAATGVMESERAEAERVKRESQHLADRGTCLVARARVLMTLAVVALVIVVLIVLIGR